MRMMERPQRPRPAPPVLPPAQPRASVSDLWVCTVGVAVGSVRGWVAILMHRCGCLSKFELAILHSSNGMGHAFLGACGERRATGDRGPGLESEAEESSGGTQSKSINRKVVVG